MIVRFGQGLLRRTHNRCPSSLIEAVRDQTSIVDLKHVNRVLIQPHWRRDCDHLAGNAINLHVQVLGLSFHESMRQLTGSFEVARPVSCRPGAGLRYASVSISNSGLSSSQVVVPGRCAARRHFLRSDITERLPESTDVRVFGQYVKRWATTGSTRSLSYRTSSKQVSRNQALPEKRLLPLTKRYPFLTTNTCF